MAQKRLLEIIVGLFLCLGLAAVFILTLRVSSLSGFGSGPTYTVHASFLNTGQLKSGAAVKLGGVQIGHVTNIALNQTTFEGVVTMAINNHYDKLPKDSSASILTAGLLGSQYVGIEPGGSLKNLKNGDKIQFTQSALILEKIIGQVLLNKTGGSSSDGTSH
jgi:phospholipid/cholesterol/gamma-HCH transport system substrate-binding protein